MLLFCTGPADGFLIPLCTSCGVSIDEDRISKQDRSECGSPSSRASAVRFSTFVPIDFGHQRLDIELERAGFRLDEPGFFSRLGVTPYLACARTRRAALPKGGSRAARKPN